MNPTSRTLPDGTLPWTRSCFVCGESNPHGLQLQSRLEGGFVVLRHTTREADRGYKHLVHGGISMTLLDEVMTWIAMVEAGRLCVAAEMSIRLHREVPVRTALTATAGLTRSNRRVLITEATLCDPAGTVLASATGKYMAMPAARRDYCHDDFVFNSQAIHPATLFCEPLPGEPPS